VPVEERLNGWKAIGGFLGRDRTTAIRWANERGLPVHRVPGGRTGTVYALQGELQHWLENGVSATPAAPVDSPPRMSAPSLLHWRSWAVIGGCAAAVASIASWQPSMRASPQVSIAAIASSHDDPATQRFADELTADLARFANASAGLAVLDKDGGANARAEYSVRTAIEGTPPNPTVRVWLTSTRDGAVLWSRRIEQKGPELVVLRERVAANVIGVLRCGLSMLAEERAGVKAPELTLLLSTCQAVFDGNYDVAAAQARAFTHARPDLATGWATLALVQEGTIGSEGNSDLRQQVRANAARAAAIAPNHVATQLAIVAGLDGPSPAAFFTLENALRLHPDEPKLLWQWSLMQFNAGYVRASVEPALRAMQVNPTWLSGRDLTVRRLAAAGRIDEAFQVQRENERLWPGHPDVQTQAAWLAVEAGTVPGRQHAAQRAGADANQAHWATVTASPSQIAKLEHEAEAAPYVAYALVRVTERQGDRRAALDWLARAPVGAAAQFQWSILFWPAAADLRREPAFFRKMVQLGLVQLWVARRQWPDFCSEPGLKYDCAAEAAKLGLLKPRAT